MKKTILALSLMSLVFVSCKKDDKDEPVTPTKENLTGSYKMTAFTVSNTSGSLDFFNSVMEACDRDDVYKLNADMSYGVEDAGTVCSPDNNYTGGTWSITGTTIDLDGETGTVKSWNGKTLVVEQVDAGTTYSQTFQKQ
jgi:hypothetical protein